MTEKILIAVVGGTAGSEPAGMIEDGYCVPLAATEGAREIIEAEGEDALGSLLDGLDVPAPPMGGLWVLEMEIEEASNGPCLLDEPTWRHPTATEMAGLLRRQAQRAAGDQRDPPDDEGRWTYLGALV